jgi:hypothetical protein
MSRPRAFVSGLADFHRTHVEEAYVAAKFGDPIKVLDVAESVYLEANGGVQVVRAALQKASGLEPDAFEVFMRPIEAAADAD